MCGMEIQGFCYSLIIFSAHFLNASCESMYVKHIVKL